VLDVLTMKPTPDELNAIEQHLDRLAAEHLDFPPNSLMDSVSPRKGPSHKR
jgi:hypothetical protein